MNDICTYLIQLRGQLELGEVNAMSPIQMTLVQLTEEGTRLSICTDQAGLIGLLRHLHALGLVVLSLNRIEA